MKAEFKCLMKAVFFNLLNSPINDSLIKENIPKSATNAPNPAIKAKANNNSIISFHPP